MSQEPRPDPRWYVEFFGKDYLNVYGDSFTDERAARESAFVERALGLKRDDAVLDLACGQGRHAVLLAKAGMRVTGQDLQADYLKLAEQAAAEAGVTIDTVHSDMRMIPFAGHFDAIINMYTAFGYLESEDEDLKVLHAVTAALKQGGQLLLDLLNREWVVDNYIQNEWRQTPDGTIVLERREFDLMTSRNRVRFISITPDGRRQESAGHNARLYTLTEITALLARAGLRFKAVHGGYGGEPYSIFTRRMIVISQKA